MDKRLELTPKQKKLVDEFQAILNEMEEENIGFIADYDIDGYGLDGFKIYNKTKVKAVGYTASSEFSSGPWTNFKINRFFSHTIFNRDDKCLDMLYETNIEDFRDLPLPSYTEDQMDVDIEALDLPWHYNDENKHLVILLKK